MYCITDAQISFILDDIRRNGIEEENLQLNLLDHICCIIEQELEENGDFEQFYLSTIKRFYKKSLSEIEEETQSLLTFKHFYFMKKLMLITGGVTSFTLTLGCILKFLHAPGANISIVVGIGSFSILFLPLMATLKIKEKQDVRDRILVIIGVLSASCISLAILFKLQHWIGANVLGLLAVAVLVLVFLPVYFISGIRNPDAKLNTIISSILLVTGCGLFLSLARTPASSYNHQKLLTQDYLRHEMLLDNELRNALLINDSSQLSAVSQRINFVCNRLKALLIEEETGLKNPDLENTILSEERNNVFYENTEAAKLLNELKETITVYNAKCAANKYLQPIPSEIPILVLKTYHTIPSLIDLVQIQLFIAQNNRL